MKKVILIILGILPIFLQAQVEQTKDTIHQIDEVIIQATRAQKDDPFTKTEVTKTEIEERNLGQDVPILLKFLPNVVTTSDAGTGVGYTGIRVRGSDATRVNVTINGIPLNDSESQGTFWVDLPDFASSVQSIQLQRGVGTSTNGAGAFGASLNLLTDAIADISGIEVQNSYGSYNTHKHNLQFDSGKLGKFFSFSGRFSLIQSDGYIDRASSDLRSFFLSGAFSNDNLLIKALAFGGHEITYQSWNGVDAKTLEKDRTFNSAGALYDEAWNVIGYYDNEVDNYTQNHYQFHLNYFFNTRLSSTFALHYTKGFGFYEQYKQDESFDDYGITPIAIENTIINSTDLIRRKWLDNDFYGATFSLKYNPDTFKILMGGAYNRYIGNHFGEVIWARYASDADKNYRYYENQGLKTDFNLFVKGQYTISDQWKAFIDLQARYITYKTTDFLEEDINENWLFFNPKLGVNYTSNEAHSFYVSYAKGHKEPNRTDFEHALIPPKPEKLDDFELGWRFTSDNIKLQANAYYMLYKDQLVLTGALDDVGAFIRANSGKSYRLGLEVDADIKLSDNWHWQPNFSFSRNKNQNFFDEVSETFNDTDISYSPNFIAVSLLTFAPNKNLQFSLLPKYVSSQFMSNTELEASKLDSYFTTDFYFQWQKEKILGVKQVTFTGMLNNLFDAKYSSNGYMWDSTPYYYPQAGTYFLLGLKLRF